MNQPEAHWFLNRQAFFCFIPLQGLKNVNNKNNVCKQWSPLSPTVLSFTIVIHYAWGW